MAWNEVKKEKVIMFIKRSSASDSCQICSDRDIVKYAEENLINDLKKLIETIKLNTRIYYKEENYASEINLPQGK